MVAFYTMKFNIEALYIVPRKYVCVFFMDLWTKCGIFLYNIKWFISMLEALMYLLRVTSPIFECNSGYFLSVKV